MAAALDNTPRAGPPPSGTHLLEGDSGRQPVFSQVKQATASVYEEFVGPSRFANHGERVVVGQRLMQSASDIFLGHLRVEALTTTCGSSVT